MEKDRKKFRDTKVGMWVNRVKKEIPELGKDVVDVLLSDNPAATIVKKIIPGLRASKNPISKELELEFLENEAEFAAEMYALEISDRQRATNLQSEALKQDDNFSKRFLYYLSAFIILTATAFGIMLFFVDIPPKNQRLVEMFADIYLFAGAIMVLQFFFGSSNGSKEKDRMLEKMKGKTK